MDTKPSILLVEDDQLLRELYVECLPADRFDVTAAQDGEEALQKLSEKQWDLVLLDMMLPKVSGYEVLNILGNDAAMRKFRKLVLMTNVEPDAQFREALTRADGYLTKSEYDPDGFVKKVTEFLSAA